MNMKERILESFPWWFKDKEVRRSRQLKPDFILWEIFFGFPPRQQFRISIELGRDCLNNWAGTQMTWGKPKNIFFFEKSFFANSKYILRYCVISCHMFNYDLTLLASLTLGEDPRPAKRKEESEVVACFLNQLLELILNSFSWLATFLKRASSPFLL